MLCCILYMLEKINFCVQPFDRYWRWEEEMKGRDDLKKDKKQNKTKLWIHEENYKSISDSRET